MAKEAKPVGLTNRLKNTYVSIITIGFSNKKKIYSPPRTKPRLCLTLLFCSSRVRCSKQLLLRKMAWRTGRSEHRNMSLIVSVGGEGVRG